MIRPMIRLTAVVILTVTVGTGVASRRIAARTNDEQDVLTAERHRFQALKEADIQALRALMREDCTYTHYTGVMQRRDDYLAPIASGKTRYEAAAPSEMVVRVFGDTAIVNGRATLNARVEGDPNPRLNDLRYTNVWVKTNGAWRLAAWHSSRVQP